MNQAPTGTAPLLLTPGAPVSLPTRWMTVAQHWSSVSRAGWSAMPSLFPTLWKQPVRTHLQIHIILGRGTQNFYP